MKIKSIAAICKKSKSVLLCDMPEYNGSIDQWVGDGSALYPLHNIPYMGTENICTIFEFTDNDMEKSFIRHCNVPAEINFHDIDPKERIINPPKMSIVCSGLVLKPLQTSQGLVFIDSKYLSPLADINFRALELYERVTKSGQIYIAAKNGLLLLAIIMPLDTINDIFLEQIETLARECRVSYERKEAANRKAAMNEPQQISLDGRKVDSGTGEILPEEADNEQEDEI